MNRRGLLRTIMAAPIAWLSRAPAEAHSATVHGRSVSDDPLGRFIDAHVVAAAGQRVNARDMYDAYRAWCEVAGEKPWMPAGFAMRMHHRGYQRGYSILVWWKDIVLTRR